MTYLRFLANFRRKLMYVEAESVDADKYEVTGVASDVGGGELGVQKVGHKVYALVGRELRIQNDVLKILLRRIQRTDGESLNVWYRLDEINGSPLLILHESSFGVRILVWTPNVLNLEKKEDIEIVKKLLTGLQELSGRSIILDEAEEIRDIFKNIYGKGSKGLIIDCSKEVTITQDFVKRRLCSVLGIVPSEEIFVDLTREDMTVGSLFNIFSLLEALNVKKLGLNDLRRFDLLKGEPERFLVDELFRKGRQEVLRYDFREITSRKFFRRLYQALILKLRVKSMSYMQPTVAAGKLEMSPFRYRQHREEVKRMNFRDLYRRLYLVFSLLRWREYPGSVYLLLLSW